MELVTKFCSLLEAMDWVDAICSCEDQNLKRFALYSCANSVLPYWQSRFEDDESMENLLDVMLAASNSPSVENDTLLKKAIPKRERRHWDLSPPPGFADENYSDCPDANYDDGTDYQGMANEHLRKKILENLRQIAA